MNEGRAIDKAWEDYWADREYVSPSLCVQKITDEEWLKWVGDYLIPDDTSLLILLASIKRAAQAEEIGDKALYATHAELVGRMIIETVSNNAVNVFGDEVASESD